MDTIRRFLDQDDDDQWSKKEVAEYTTMILKLSADGPITVLASVFERVDHWDPVPFYECTWYAVRDNIKLRTDIVDDDREHLLGLWTDCTESADGFIFGSPSSDGKPKREIMDDKHNLPFIRTHNLRAGGNAQQMAAADAIEHMQRVTGLI